MGIWPREFVCYCMQKFVSNAGQKSAFGRFLSCVGKMNEKIIVNIGAVYTCRLLSKHPPGEYKAHLNRNTSYSIRPRLLVRLKQSISSIFLRLLYLQKTPEQIDFDAVFSQKESIKVFVSET